MLNRLLDTFQKYFKTDARYLLRSGFWMNLNYFVFSLLGFILSVVFANFATKEAFGTYQFFLSLNGIITIFSLSGMNTAVTRAVTNGREGTLQRALKIQLRWSVVPILISSGMSLYYFFNGNTQIATALLIIALFNPLFNAFNTYLAFIVGKRDFSRGFWYSMYLNIPYYITMMVIIFISQSPIVYLLTNLGINTLLTIALYFSTVKAYQPNDIIDTEAIKFGKSLSVINVLSTVVSQIDNILVFHFLGPAQLAIYAFASTLPEKIGGLTKFISVAALPKYSEENRVTDSTIVGKTIKFSIFALFIAIAYILAAPLLFKIFFPQYSSSILYSQAYSLMLVASAAGLPQSALLGKGHEKELYIYNAIWPLVQLPVLYCMVFYYGIWGIIVGKIIFGFISIFIALALLSRRITTPHENIN